MIVVMVTIVIVLVITAVAVMAAVEMIAVVRAAPREIVTVKDRLSTTSASALRMAVRIIIVMTAIVVARHHRRRGCEQCCSECEDRKESFHLARMSYS